MGETPSRIDAEKVAALYGTQVAGNLNLALGESRSERIPVHRPPRNLPERQKTFAGREAELEELHQELSANADVGITQQTAVHGHGGVGKTSIATEYGWRHLGDYPGGVFFLSCEASPGAPRLEELAPHLGLSVTGTPEDTAQRVRAHLETGEPSLLLLDNVRGPEQCLADDWTRSLPAGACRRLITTRAEMLPGVHMYRLQRLSREDGVKLLARYRADVTQDEALASRLVEWFDGLAVGLTVVGVYMQMHPDLPWERYVDALDKKGLGAVRGTEKAVSSLLRYQQRVDAVFDDVLDSLPAEEQRALEYAALLPEDNIYAPWLVELMDEDGVEAPELPGYEGHTGERAVGALVRRQLLRPRGEDAVVLGLHRVLRRRVGERLHTQGGRDTMLDRLATFAERRGEASHAALTGAALRRELTPLAYLSREFAMLGRWDTAVSLANWISTPLRGLGRYTEARDLLESFETTGELTGVPETEILTFNSQLGLVLKSLGELGEARKRMERAIQISESNFAADHSTRAKLYSNQATILNDLGELGEARRWMEKAMDISENSFPVDDPQIATRNSNLCSILLALGELEEARERIERAIQIGERSLAADHPLLATYYSNLAMVLQRLGELEEARVWMERAIRIEEHNFASDHPTLATSYHNLALIEWALGRVDAACALFQQALVILLKHFPSNHRSVEQVSAAVVVACADHGTPPDAVP